MNKIFTGYLFVFAVVFVSGCQVERKAAISHNTMYGLPENVPTVTGRDLSGAAPIPTPITQPSPSPTPIPQIKATKLGDGTTLGAWYMPGWTAGSAMVNKRLNETYYGRMPLFGWDENSPQAMAAQDKWASEAGLGFFIFDYYHTQPVYLPEDEAPQVARLQLALQRFRELNNPKMNYAVALTLGGPSKPYLQISNGLSAKSIQPWTQQIDDWILHDFSKANYLRVDNRLVLFVNSPHILKEIFEPPQPCYEAAVPYCSLKAALDDLRQQVKNKLNGTELWVVGVVARNESYATLKSYSDAGFNAFTGYGPASQSAELEDCLKYDPNKLDTDGDAIVEEQMPYAALIDGTLKRAAAMTDAANNPAKFIPTIVVGYDNRPWRNSDEIKKGKSTEKICYVHEAEQSPESFSTHLKFVKNFFDSSSLHPAQAAKLFGKRMAILSAWNELGMGSYLVPTVSAGKPGLDHPVRLGSFAKQKSDDPEHPQAFPVDPSDASLRLIDSASSSAYFGFLNQIRSVFVGPSGPIAPKNSEVDVYILAGQSNAYGLGTLPKDYNPAPEVARALFAYDVATLKITTDTGFTERDVSGQPIFMRGSTTPSALRSGAEFELAKQLVKLEDARKASKATYVPHQVAILKYTVGASSLVNNWSVGDPNSDRAKCESLLNSDFKFMFKCRLLSFLAAQSAHLNAMGYTPIFKGFIWIQGESDTSIDPVKIPYQQELIKLIQDVRVTTKNLELPIIISQTASLFSSHLTQDDPKGQQDQLEQKHRIKSLLQIRAAQNEVFNILHTEKGQNVQLMPMDGFQHPITLAPISVGEKPETSSISFDDWYPAPMGKAQSGTSPSESGTLLTRTITNVNDFHFSTDTYKAIGCTVFKMWNPGIRCRE